MVTKKSKGTELPRYLLTESKNIYRLFTLPLEFVRITLNDRVADVCDPETAVRAVLLLRSNYIILKRKMQWDDSITLKEIKLITF